MTGIKEQIRKWIGVFLLICLDLSVFAISLSIAHGLRQNLNAIVTTQFNTPFRFYISIWWIPFIYGCIFFYEGLYNRRSPYWDEVGRLLRADFLATGVVFAILTLMKMSDRFSRMLLVLMWLCMSLLHPLFRLWGKRILFYLRIWREKVAIRGSGTLALSVADALAADRHMGFEVIGFVSPLSPDKADMETPGGRNFPILGTLEQAIQSGMVSHSTQMVYAEEGQGSEAATARLNDMIRYFHNVLIVPSSLRIPVLNTEPLHLFREQMMVLKIKNNLLSPINRLVKRFFDLALTLLAMPVVLPLGLVLVVLIRLESKGAAVFRQERIGCRGKPFRLCKFRSMYLSNEEILERYLTENIQARSEWQQYRKLHGKDPRVTWIGRFIRQTSLDELPQLWNVFKGDMSLVGPRPYLPDEQDEMEEKYSMIVAAKPGISGLWQVSGRSNLDFHDRLRLDEWYVSNWTLWLDVEILVKTIAVVLKRDGAY